MAMYYCRPKGCTLAQTFYKTARIRRRRPYYVLDTNLKKNGTTTTATTTTQAIKTEPNNDYIDVETNNSGTEEQTEPSSGKTDDNVAKIKTENVFKRKKGNTKLLKKQKLNDILQKLIDRIPEGVTLLPVTGTLVNHLSSSTSGRSIDLHQPQQHVSPRKRILRELEKVSLDDQSTMKRSRAKGTNTISHLVISPPTPTSTNINYTNNTIGNASQHINFPSSISTNGSNNNNKIVNGIHDSGKLPPPPAVTQSTSRPISSYSITSLLGHNNNNSSSSSNNNNNVAVKIEPGTTHNHKDSSAIDHQRRTTAASPRSPSSNHYHASTSCKPSAFNSAGGTNSNNSGKKKSPTYSTSLSPVITAPIANNRFNRSPSLNSPVNYGRNRSPDLSPSPEQTYTRYRQAPYGTIPHNSTSVSSPSSTIFHPYLSSVSSRGSPSHGALSPPTSSDTHRYRYGSPNHQSSFSLNVPAQNSSPLSFSRYSPLGYSQISPQHYTSKSSANFNLKRDLSPNGISSRTAADPLRDAVYGSSSGGASNSNVPPRTVPKKTAALRQPYGSPPIVSSPNTDSRNCENNIYKSTTSSGGGDHKKQNESTSSTLNLSRSRSPDISKQYEKDYRMHNSTINNSAVLSGLSEAAMDSSSNMIRPNLVPSLQHSPGMYYMYPQSSSAVNMPATAPPYLPPVYYHSMAFAGSYRTPLWMHYPTAMQPPRLTAGNMLAYGGGGGVGAAGMIGSHIPGLTGPNHPWVPHHTLMSDDPVSLIRIKDEPSSGM